MTTATEARPVPRKLGVPVESWLDELRRARRLSPRTLDAYARDLADYTAFALQHGLASWDEASLTFVDGYFAM
ncbi:MAG: site-specific integrase, partial [Candidatus Eisenbacteria bacterium]|nr:site-specific integrase [Candidatus Eisenbacteria bacterium]